MSLQYYLVPNTVTTDPNDQTARVETIANLTDSDLAHELVTRGVCTSKAQAAAVISGYQEVIAQKLADGFAINTPLVSLRVGIEGVFTNPDDSFDSSRHTLRGNFKGGPLLADALANASTQKILKGDPAPLVVSFTNKSTGAVNGAVTPAGIGQINGDQLKFDPAAATAGIYFVPATGTAVKVPTANIATRTEGSLLFTIPALTAGTYHLEVRRVYGTAARATLRTGSLSATLTVA